MNQKVALGLLKRLGYRADVASNGLEALAALERQPYDVVLMDVQMPELDGLDASRRICERWPPESRPHIIAMTANALPEDREACFAAGMNDYVAKPIRGDELAAALKRARPLRNRDAGSGESRRRRCESPRGCRAPEPARPRRRRVPHRGSRRLPRGCAGADHEPPQLARAPGHRGAPPSGAHAEVERLDAGRNGVRGALPHRRAARQGRPPRRRLAARGSDRAGVPDAPGNPRLPSVGTGFVSGSAPAAGTILIADDNRVNRLLLGRGLEQDGHTVVFAEHGREALDLLRRRRFDLMLLDVLMPELDGYGVLEELQRDPHLRDIPVVVTSSLDELDSVVRCLEMGAEDYLTKPVNHVLLNARVNASLEKKRLRDQQRELISKFATKEVAEDLLTSGFSLGGKYVDASAMFCDIRSFTTIAEAQDPAETIALLNDYYTLMMDAINGEGGIVSLDGRRRPDGDLRRALAARGPSPGRGARGAADDRLDPPVQRGAGGAGQGADPDRCRDRVGTGRRRLHRDAAARDLHVRRRHRQCRGTTRVAHQGRQAADPHRREHAAAASATASRSSRRVRC